MSGKPAVRQDSMQLCCGIGEARECAMCDRAAMIRQEASGQVLGLLVSLDGITFADPAAPKGPSLLFEHQIAITRDTQRYLQKN